MCATAWEEGVPFVPVSIEGPPSPTLSAVETVVPDSVEFLVARDHTQLAYQEDLPFFEW